MDWFIAKQERRTVTANTVAELIEILKQCPQDWPIRTADSGEFCEINIATDGVDKEVSLY